jgi:hypothetical protein
MMVTRGKSSADVAGISVCSSGSRTRDVGLSGISRVASLSLSLSLSLSRGAVPVF